MIHHGSNSVGVQVFAISKGPAKDRFDHEISKVPRFSPNCREMQIVDVLAEAGSCKHLFKVGFQ
jgi:hypothetical protein